MVKTTRFVEKAFPNLGEIEERENFTSDTTVDEEESIVKRPPSRRGRKEKQTSGTARSPAPLATLTAP